MTHTHVHTHVTFANPHLTCEQCGQQARAWHNPDVCGCDAQFWLVPCRHRADVHDTCPSWSPADGCTCQDHLGHVPHPPAA